MPRTFELLSATRRSYLRTHHAQEITHLSAALALPPAQVRALGQELGLYPPAPPRRAYTHFTAAQLSYLRAHYADLPPAHFAQCWGVSVGQVYELAARHGLKRRAPNGRPAWRGKAGAWPAGSRWAA